MPATRAGSSAQRELFDAPSGLPDALVYRPGFLTPSDEQSLIAEIRALPLTEARYKAFTAKRRIVSFGYFETNALLPAPPLPPSLLPLRDGVSEWTAIPAAGLSQCTIAEYAPGTQLGWHRDVPLIGSVVGVSLGSPCRMRLRPYPHVRHGKSRSLVLVLEPRSAYGIRSRSVRRDRHRDV